MSGGDECPFQKCVIAALATVAALGLAAIGVLYISITSGGSVARDRDPPHLEIAVAQWLLHRSVPGEIAAMKNPLSAAADGPDVAGGKTIFRKKCEICHGYDGGGRTEVGAGQYPRPPNLRDAGIQAKSDGEFFYHIRNGIRQVVAYLRNLPPIAAMDHTTENAGPSGSATYLGSGECKTCHADIYERWSKTRMANVVLDPKKHPDAIIPDLNKSDPLVKFSLGDIAFTYGSKWMQRYFRQVGDDYFPLEAQWDVFHKQWKPYHVPDGADWWTKVYSSANSQRPTGPLCDGCHSVNYDIATKKVTEWNVGCERCHGPGSEHVKRKGHGGIVNPARLNHVQANDVCIQCHSQGQPLANPIQGKYYDWPVGFHVGRNRLSDVWKLEEHQLGETSFTHFADGTAHKNRMQGNDFVGSLMYARGVTCFSCHDVHGSKHEAVLCKPAKVLCLDCHGPNSPNGPHAATIEQHTHHKAGSAGNECIECHMPKIAQTIGDINVRSHTFHFVSPAKTQAMKIPNACNVCHADKPASWAVAVLKTWTDLSPWRMDN
jgi:predicted CXXCH cytochrome family protein